MRRYGWISLFAILTFAACGAPEVSNLGSSSDDDGGPIGDDDDDDGNQETPIPTPGSTLPNGSPAPTLTNVPSYATWDATIEQLGCSNCHAGGSGGLSMVPNSTDPSIKRYNWFTHICNRNGSANPTTPGAGIQTFNPASGRLIAFYCNQPFDLNGDGDTNDAGERHSSNQAPPPQSSCDAVRNWLQTGTADPPSCFGDYDLMNSQ